MILYFVVIAVVSISLIAYCLTKKSIPPPTPPPTSTLIPTNQQVLPTHKTAEDSVQAAQLAAQPTKKGAVKSKQAMKTGKELQQAYGELYGTISIKNQKKISVVTALTVRNSKVLFGTSRNQLCMYDLRKWKPRTPCQDMFFTSLDNNTATALAISTNFYFAALSFDKTIIYFEFKGGEGGVYFREVKRFPRNIYKGTQGAMAVNQSEKFIVSAGVENDTSVSVWSMEGERLASVSSYQIEHYSVHFGGPLVLVLGWTSQIKSFKLQSDKEGNFLSLDKSTHLTHSQKPATVAVDIQGIYALTITADASQVKLWQLTTHGSPHQTTKDTQQIGLDSAKYCAVVTLRNENERLKTVVIVASSDTIVVLDRSLKTVKQFSNLSVEGLYSFGATRSAVLATMSNGRMSVWDLTKLVQEQPEYTL